MFLYLNRNLGVRLVIPVVLLVLLGLNGCSMQAEYKDVSDEPRLSGVINSRYKTKTESTLYGISHDGLIKGTTLSSDSPVHVYVVILGYGIGGREVKEARSVSAGFEFTVSKVLYCENCLATELARLEFEIVNENIEGLEDSIPMKLTINKLVADVHESGDIVLKSELFEKLD